MTRSFRSTLVSFCVALLGAATTLHAATWQPVPLFGGQILSLASAPSASNIAYAGLAPAGVVRSDDGGRTWRSPSPAAEEITAGRLLVSSVDPRTLFATAGPFSDTFARSRDGGATWTFRPIGPEVVLLSATALTLDPRAPRGLWAATSNGLYRSADLGDTWTQVALAGFHAEAVGVDPRHANLLFVIGREENGEGQLLTSRDGGGHWREVPDFPGIVEEPRFAFAPGALGPAFLLTEFSLFRSDDEGRTWIDVTGLLSTYVRDFALAPSGSLLISTPLGVLHSLDFGDSWLPEANAQGVRRNAGPDGTVSPLAPLPGNGNAILSGSDRGVWRSGSGGAGWRASSEGISAHHIRDVAASSAAVPRVLALTPEVFASADSGASWKRTESRGIQNVAAFRMEHLAFDPRDGDRVYTHGAGGLYVSRDGGQQWHRLLTLYDGYPFFLEQFNSALAIDPTNPKKLYLSAGADVRFEPGRVVTFAYSTDGGRTWTFRRHPFEAAALAVDPHRPKTLYATTNGPLRKSPDAGTTWQIAGDLRRTLSLALDPDRTDALWVGTADGAVFRSADGGATFEPLGEPLGGAVATLVADPKRPEGVYAGVAGQGIYRWDPVSASWLLQGDGLPAARFEGAFAVDSRRDVLWAATAGSGLLRLELE